MTKWKYIEPEDSESGNWEPKEIVMTENEILEKYYPYWAQQAMRHNENLREGQTLIPITPKACIEDWIIVHWATEVK